MGAMISLTMFVVFANRYPITISQDFSVRITFQDHIKNIYTDDIIVVDGCYCMYIIVFNIISILNIYLYSKNNKKKKRNKNGKIVN